MTRKGDRGSAASVRDRLLKLAKARKEDFQRVLVQYGNERLLYRLSKSEHANQFVLKGATLFAIWATAPHRSTKDLDFLGFGAAEEERLLQIFREVIALEVERDGLIFDVSTLAAAPIRANAEYDGIRLTMTTMLGTARIPIQVDVGFGDATGIPPEDVEVPTLLDDQPRPTVRAYSREVVVAEKFHAMVNLGLVNTRMKDYYDILVLSQRFEFDGPRLKKAVAATFDRRQTAVPKRCPDGLHDDFGADVTKNTQWRAFLRRTGAEEVALGGVVTSIRAFLLPVAEAVWGDGDFEVRWQPSGPWASAPR